MNFNFSDCLTDETISHDGHTYRVLDVEACMSLHRSLLSIGTKSKPIWARIAKPGEEIITKPGAVEETVFTCQGGEAIFINSPEDIYVPRDEQGVSNGMAILNDKYDLIKGDILNGETATYKPKTSPTIIAHEIVVGDIVILDAYGSGKHQFLTDFATLKILLNRVTGIDKVAFDATWTILD